MTITKKDIDLMRKRLNESYKRQILSQPEKRCRICNWFLKYEWKQQQVAGLEAEIRRLRRRLNNKLKPRTDAYSLKATR